MPTFSTQSLSQLASCHPDLQTLFHEVIKYFDCKINEGFRDEATQNKAFAEGKSKLRWPNGNHNQYPSMAVDVYPCPIDMKDTHRFYFFAGRVLGIADILKIQGKMLHSVRWGGDWNSDTEIKDNTFNDLVHFELV